MRVVGNTGWSVFASTPMESLKRGAVLDALVASMGLTLFQAKGVFRGTPAMFNQMDDERAMKIKAWGDEHIKIDIQVFQYNSSR